MWVLHDNLKKPTRFFGPEHFKHREIGTEPSRRGAVLASHMGDKFKGKWEMSKERGYASDEEQEDPKSNKKMVLRQWNEEQKRNESSWKNLLERNTNASVLSRRPESERRTLMVTSLDELSFVISNYEKILQLHRITAGIKSIQKIIEF